MNQGSALIWDFNLLATTERGNESGGCSELWMLLRAVGDDAPSVDRSHVMGLIAAKTRYDPVEAVRRLREEFQGHPDYFRVLLRIIPVEVVVRTDLEEIAEAAHRLTSRIEEEESFRITVEKRRTSLRSMEVIDAVASGIDRKVNLESPDWVVLIEIVGNATGVSVIHPDRLLNVQKERAQLSLEGQERSSLDEQQG